MKTSIDVKLTWQTWPKDNPYMALCQRKNMETLFQIIQKSKLYICINDLRLAMLGQPSIKIHPNPNSNPNPYAQNRRFGFGGPNKFPLLKLSKPSSRKKKAQIHTIIHKPRRKKNLKKHVGMTSTIANLTEETIHNT